MRSVSARFADSLGGACQWATEVDWTNDGGTTWTAARFISGTVTASGTSQTRWACSLVLDGVDIGRDGLNPFSTQLRVRHGLRWGRESELIGMGVYQVTTVSRSSTTPTQVSVAGESFEAYLIEARVPTPVTIAAGPAGTVLPALIRDVLPDARIAWRGVDQDQLVPKMVVERDRWPMIDGPKDATSIARALGARVFCDGDGTFVVSPVPALTDEPSWTAEAGRGGLLIEATEELSSDGVYNAIVVWGEQTDGGAVAGPGIAVDNDPFSLTYFYKPVSEGGFGPRPRFYTSSLITSDEQASTTARAMLAPLLGLRQRATFTSLHDPTKEPGDVGRVLTAGGLQLTILDSVTYDLLGGPLSCETRATATRLAGDVVDAPEEGSEE